MACCRTIVPCLVEKFTDSKVLVRNATLKVLRTLVTSTQHPNTLVELLAGGLEHPDWHVREEVVNTLIMVC